MKKILLIFTMLFSITAHGYTVRIDNLTDAKSIQFQGLCQGIHRANGMIYTLAKKTSQLVDTPPICTKYGKKKADPGTQQFTGNIVIDGQKLPIRLKAKHKPRTLLIIIRKNEQGEYRIAVTKDTKKNRPK